MPHAGGCWRSEPRTDVLAGKTVLLTGATSGLGREAVAQLAALGARSSLAGRGTAKLAAVRADLRQEHQADRFPTVVVDMASLASVRAAVERVLDTEPRLDVLIDNAGAIFPTANRRPGRDRGDARDDGRRPVHPDRRPPATAAPRPVARGSSSVTSGGQYAQRLDLDDLQSAARARTTGRERTPARSGPRCALIREWARRARRRIRSSRCIRAGPTRRDSRGACPASSALDGPAAPHARRGRRHDRLAGARPTATGSVAGQLFLDRRPRPFDRVPATRLSPAERRRLWDAVVALAGLPTRSPTRTPPPEEPDDHAARTYRDRTCPIEATFDFVADFANAADWDSGRRVGPPARRPGPVGVGARYRLGVRMGGRVAPMKYRISAFERPDRRRPGRLGSGVDAVDDIRFIPDAATAPAIDYTADIRLGGLLRLAAAVPRRHVRRIARACGDRDAATLAWPRGRRPVDRRPSEGSA